MDIIGISGSLREGSYNTALLRAAAQAAPPGVRLDIAPLGGIPLYNAEVQQAGFPDPVSGLAERLRAADAVLIATPEYNFSVPGVLKNAIDWVSRVPDQPFAGKAVALLGASAGALGTARAQYHLRQVFLFLDARVMNRPEVFVGAASQKFDEAGNLSDGATRDFLASYMEAVRDWASAVRRMAG